MRKTRIIESENHLLIKGNSVSKISWCFKLYTSGRLAGRLQIANNKFTGWPLCSSLCLGY